MAAYGSDAILRELLGMRRELWENLARTHQQRRRLAYERDVAREDVAAAVYFVKRLAMTAEDVQLLGQAELLKMEMDDAGDELGGGWQPDEATRAAMERKPIINEPHAYSSNDIIVLLGQLVGQDAQERYPRGCYLLDDWVTQAALFVKRLAARTRDGDLLGAVELAILDEERRDRERGEEIRREEEQRRLEFEEDEHRKWETYEHVSNTQIGSRLNPPLAPRDVNKLLNAAGFMAKNDANEWVFTAAGVEYGKPDFAKEGGKVPWAAWAKTVLPVLQAVLDRGASAAPAPTS